MATILVTSDTPESIRPLTEPTVRMVDMPFDREVYKRRNIVERCFNRLKQWRGIATRYDKTAESCKAAVTLASLLMWA